MKPKVSDLAKASKASYEMTGKGNKMKRIERTMNEAPEGWIIMPEHTDKQISVFKNDIDDYIIAHRGSDFLGTQGKKDVVSDWNILIGKPGSDRAIKRRVMKTEKIVKKLKKDTDNPNIYLTGHSLGSVSAYQSMLSSDIVRDNIKEFHSFNSGSSPVASNKIDNESDLYKNLKEKSTHHRVLGDTISAFNRNNMIGDHKTYKSDKQPSVADKVVNIVSSLAGIGTIFKVGSKIKEKLSKHSIDNFIIQEPV